MVKHCIICNSIGFEIKSELFCSQKCIHKYGLIKAIDKIKCEVCGKDIGKHNYKKHLKTHKIKPNYFCEYCENEVFEKYGSGRFCSSKCARGFSTKVKRKEINEKVKNKLQGIDYIKKCLVCDNEFVTKKENKLTCSVKCGHIESGRKHFGLRYSIKDTSKMGGIRQNGGKSKQFQYINWLGFSMSLNKEEIKVAEELDNLKLNWKRNSIGFPYTTINGISRKYYPDFIVNQKIFIEYKGWITEEMEYKMNDAKIKNNLNLIIVIGNDKRYFSKGIKISELKNISVV